MKTSRLKALLVEDDDRAREFLEAVLRSRGHDVAACPNATMAWEAYQQVFHELVILDWLLPGMDGLELCRLMRGLPRGKSSVILMVTVRNHPQELQEVLEAGADDYLSKPVDLGLLEVRLTIAERRARERAEGRQAEEERKQLEAQFQHTQKLESLGVLAGGIAHDFNNLLMSILGYAGLAMIDVPLESPARYSVEQIETAGLRAAELTNQLLAYTGKTPLIIQPLSLSKLVEEMAHLLEAIIPKAVVVEYHFDPDPPPIDGDASQLRQVAMNLITNASEAIGDGSGVIRVSTGEIEVDHSYLSETYLGHELPDGRYVFLEVSDTGSGMDEEMRERIFDPFFTTKSTGRGLGLAALMGIVRGHRGAIRLHSEPGRGTTFRVLFPCSEQAGEEPPGRPRIARGLQGRGTILVVDDEDSVRTVSRMMLEKCGFTVLTARDGKEGVDLFREYSDNIAAVILDLTMPQMDGEEAFHEIRRIRPDARVMLSSGYPEEDASYRFAGKGLAGFIQKPYGPMLLIEKLEELLQD
ncbi:MAG: response regulator [Candidatus Tectomicrobia bacterium]|nr:response regulator [Candidatus Tectomicrobia bacterium]